MSRSFNVYYNGKILKIDSGEIDSTYTLWHYDLTFQGKLGQRKQLFDLLASFGLGCSSFKDLFCIHWFYLTLGRQGCLVEQFDCLNVFARSSFIK